MTGVPVTAVTVDLERLRAGASAWVSRNVHHLEPSRPGPPDPHRVKAWLELGLLNRIWTRLRPGDAELTRVTETVVRIWSHPGTPDLLAASPRHLRIYALSYLALAPPGHSIASERMIRERAIPDGRFPSYGKSAHVRIEARYFAELAGLPHGSEPYEELYPHCLLARWSLGQLPAKHFEVYLITHLLFHLSDFGAREPVLTGAQRNHAIKVIDSLADWALPTGNWDLMAELLLCQHILNPAAPPRADLLAELVAAQTPTGAIPAWCAARRPADEQFQPAYHPTLVTAITALIILDTSRDR
jgi:hypothetical protein